MSRMAVLPFSRAHRSLFVRLLCSAAGMDGCSAGFSIYLVARKPRLVAVSWLGETDVAFVGDYDGSIVAVLEQVRLTADLEGLAILDTSPDAADAPVAYCLGVAGPGTIELGRALLRDCPGRPSHVVAPDQR